MLSIVHEHTTSWYSSGLWVLNYHSLDASRRSNQLDAAAAATGKDRLRPRPSGTVRFLGEVFACASMWERFPFELRETVQWIAFSQQDFCVISVVCTVCCRFVSLHTLHSWKWQRRLTPVEKEPLEVYGGRVWSVPKVSKAVVIRTLFNLCSRFLEKWTQLFVSLTSIVVPWHVTAPLSVRS